MREREHFVKLHFSIGFTNKEIILLLTHKHHIIFCIRTLKRKCKKLHQGDRSGNYFIFTETLKQSFYIFLSVRLVLVISILSWLNEVSSTSYTDCQYLAFPFQRLKNVTISFGQNCPDVLIPCTVKQAQS